MKNYNRTDNNKNYFHNDIVKIGIDAGKYGLKAVTKVNGKWDKFYIRSKFTKNPNNIVLGNNYLINYKDDHYLIGDGGEDYSLDTDKQSLQHKLCTYLAVEHFAQDETALVVLGTPLNLFTNPQKREEYRDYIIEDSIIEFKVNYNSKEICLQEVIPFPECGGIAYSQPDEDFQNTIRGVLDIGGLNVTGCLFDNLNPVKDTDFTENLGSIILMNSIKDELNKQYPNVNLKDYDIPGILKNGLFIDGKLNKYANDIIQKTIDKHFERIIKVMKKKGWSPKTMKLTVGGGGSLDIGIETIQKFIPQSKLSLDPVWDNAKGNYIVSELLY